MPIYEFKCENCGETFEILCRMNDQMTPPCHACQSKRTQRLLSAFSGKIGSSSGGGCGGCTSSHCGSCGH